MKKRTLLIILIPITIALIVASKPKEIKVREGNYRIFVEIQADIPDSEKDKIIESLEESNIDAIELTGEIDDKELEESQDITIMNDECRVQSAECRVQSADESVITSSGRMLNYEC